MEVFDKHTKHVMTEIAIWFRVSREKIEVRIHHFGSFTFIVGTSGVGLGVGVMFEDHVIVFYFCDF